MVVTALEISAGRAVVECLKAQRVKYVFGIAGNSTLPIVSAISDERTIEYINVRHEQIALHMADGYARSSGGLGVVLLTRAGGAANAVIGTMTAYSNDSPVLLIIGQAESYNLGRDDYQEFDLVSIFKPFTKYSFQAACAENIPEVVRRAIKSALADRPGPVMVSIPGDYFDKIIPFQPATRDAYSASVKIYPDPARIKAAAKLLANASRPVILAGNGVIYTHAAEELLKLSEMLSIPVVPGSFNYDVYPNDHALYVRDYKWINGVDVALVVGTSVTDLTLPAYSLVRNAKVIHVELDSKQIGKLFPIEIGIIGDIRETLEKMKEESYPLLTDDTKKVIERRLEYVHDIQKRFLSRTFPKESWSTEPVMPWVFLKKIREALPRDTIIVHDSSCLSEGWMSQYFDFYKPHTNFNDVSAFMGFGLPGALGVKLGCPTKPVVNINGDGAFLMVISALSTAMTYNIPITVIINNDSAFMQIKRQQDHPFGTDLENPNLANIAKEFGFYSERVLNPKEIPRAVKSALEQNAVGKPALIEIITTNDPKYSTPDRFFKRDAVA